MKRLAAMARGLSEGSSEMSIGYCSPLSSGGETLQEQEWAEIFQLTRSPA